MASSTPPVTHLYIKSQHTNTTSSTVLPNQSPATNCRWQHPLHRVTKSPKYIWRKWPYYTTERETLHTNNPNHGEINNNRGTQTVDSLVPDGARHSVHSHSAANPDHGLPDHGLPDHGLP